MNQPEEPKQPVPAGKPHFELKRVYDDGTSSVAQIAAVGAKPTEGQLGRRSFFGTMLAAGAALLAFTGEAEAESKSSVNARKKKCKKKKKKGYKWSNKKKKCVKSTSTTYCSCNKVCTCNLVYR